MAKTKSGHSSMRDPEEIELTNARDELDKAFKPLFQEYEESDGIPLKVLKKRLREAGASEHISPDKLDVLLKRADADEDGHLNYDEFVQVVLAQDSVLLTSQQLTTFQRMVRGAVSSVVPQHTFKRGGDVVEDYISYYSCKPPPLFMILISLAEVVVFIVYAVQLKDTKTPVTATSGCPLYSPLIYNPSRRYEAWRYLSYMLLHSGYIHLIFNLIFQLFLGIPLEMVHKWWRVGIVYSLGVIAGSLAHSVTDTNTLLAGASGGCYALVGAHLAIVIMNWKEMTHEWMSGVLRFLCSAPMRLVVWILFAGVDIGMAIWKRYTGEDDGNVGYAAHLGGALCGLLIGIPVLKNIDEKPWERIVWWVALVVYALAVVFAVCWNVFWPHYPNTDWRPCCPMPLY